MNADALLSRLEGVRRSGPGRWLARCPAHEDRRASLSVRELDDGRVLLHDFAGCSTLEVLSAVGLDYGALYPERALDHRVRPEARRVSLRDLVAALDFELILGLVVLSDVAAGRELTAADRERAAVTVTRINHILGELRDAG